MRILLLILFILNFKNYLNANEIDSLKNNIEVNYFVTHKVNNYWKGTNFFDTTIYDKKVNRFFKIDLDNNGLNDLVIDGTNTFAVIDLGNNKYQTKSMEKYFSKYKIDTIFYKNKTPLFVLICNSALCKTKYEIKDTLVYKFGSFIEYNEKPSKIKFEEIKFRNSQSMGQNAVFDIIIKKDKNLEYDAINNNKSHLGKYYSTISEKSLNGLIEILDYIKLNSLKDEYSVNATDQSTWILEIKYNGKVKIIKDHGQNSTFGLLKLYDQIYKIIEEQGWNK